MPAEMRARVAALRQVASREPSEERMWRVKVMVVVGGRWVWRRGWKAEDMVCERSIVRLVLK